MNRSYLIEEALLVSEENVEQKAQEVLFVEIPPAIVEEKKRFFIEKKKKNSMVPGFHGHDIPDVYVEMSWKNSLEEILVHFFFITYARKIFIEKIKEQGGSVPPVLIPYVSSNIAKNEIVYSIKLYKNTVAINSTKEMKKIKFSLRKRYRDLDKQAEALIKKESAAAAQYIPLVTNKDWVKLIVRWQGAPDESEVWININDEAVDSSLMKELYGRKVEETFLTRHPLFYDYLSGGVCEINESILVKIATIVPYAFFSFDRLKNYFNCGNEHDFYDSIISLLSFRNDMTLRRECISSVLFRLFTHYKVSVDEQLVMLYKEEIEKNIVFNADYLVYQSQPNFKFYVHALASKQTQENILIDYLAKKEEITITTEDVALYFNILQRPRMKDVIYFDHSLFCYKNHAILIPHEVVCHKVLREKTLNAYAIQLQSTSKK